MTSASSPTTGSCGGRLWKAGKGEQTHAPFDPTPPAAEWEDSGLLTFLQPRQDAGALSTCLVCNCKPGNSTSEARQRRPQAPAQEEGKDAGFRAPGPAVPRPRPAWPKNCGTARPAAGGGDTGEPAAA